MKSSIHWKTTAATPSAVDATVTISSALGDIERARDPRPQAASDAGLDPDADDEDSRALTGSSRHGAIMRPRRHHDVTVDVKLATSASSSADGSRPSSSRSSRRKRRYWSSASTRFPPRGERGSARAERSRAAVRCAPRRGRPRSPRRTARHATSRSQRLSSACARSWRNRSRSIATQSSYQSGSTSPKSVTSARPGQVGVVGSSRLVRLEDGGVDVDVDL